MVCPTIRSLDAWHGQTGRGTTGGTRFESGSGTAHAGRGRGCSVSLSPFGVFPQASGDMRHVQSHDVVHWQHDAFVYA